MTKETNKLAIDQDGLLVETGKKQINVDDIKELLQINYQPVNTEVVVQLLPAKAITTSSGIALPESKKELKAAIVAVTEGSKFKRGQVIRLDAEFFMTMNPSTRQLELNMPVHYIEDKPLLQVPEHFIKGIYTNVDLSDWK
jgi:hypothetical protein